MGGHVPSTGHPHIQALAEFLEPDPRPTAIFQIPEDGNRTPADSRSIYQNRSFTSLRLNEDFVRAALDRLRPSAAASTPPCLAKGDALRHWRLRAISEGYEVLVQLFTGDEDSREPTGPLGDPAASLVCESSPRNESNASLEITPSDWTQYDVPGISPWIKWARSIDWSATEMGDITSWSPTLRGHMLNMMANPNPRLIIWGPRMTFVYNEACIPHWGAKHPQVFAKPINEAWAETWIYLEPIISAVYRGEVMQQHNLSLPIARNGYPEETWFDYTMLPIHGSNGQIDGVIDEIHETTATVRWNRRRESLVSFGKNISNALDLDGLWSGCLQGLESAVEDVAFALLYAVVDAPNYPTATATITSDEDVKTVQACVLQGSVGLQTSSQTIPETFLLDDSRSSASDIRRACAEACKNRVSIALTTKESNMPDALQVGVPGRVSGEVVQRAVVTPIVSNSGNNILGVLIIGLNPRSPFDEELRMYIDYLGDLLTKAASLISLPQEQKRAQQTSNDVNTALSAKLRMVTLQAERSEAKFARMAAEAPTGMFVYGGDGRPLYANDEYLQIIGKSRESHFEMTKSPNVSAEVVHEDDVERFREAYKQVMEQKIPVTVEYRLNTPWTTIDKATGQEITGERWLLANVFPDVDYDGELQSVQGWVTDVSHRHFTEKLVSRKLEEALESKRVTEGFIDMTSHEMRNPLSAMLQSADSIVTMINAANLRPPSQACVGQTCTLDNDAASDVLDAAQTIVLCAQHQKRIVDDILTLSKLDASLLEMCPEKVRLPPLLDTALKMFEAEIARVDTRTKVVIEPSYDELNVDWVVLDSSRLLQIIINLVTNSIKFIQQSEKRKITIALGASYEKPSGKHHGVSFVPRTHKDMVQSPAAGWGDGEDVYIQIAVTDTGTGLSEDEMKLLFHRFSQGSPKTYKQYGGSGLGLYISRQLCEIQGGQIGASSSDGNTTFTFFVRAKRGQPDRRRSSGFPGSSACTAIPCKPPVRLDATTNGIHDRTIDDIQPAPHESLHVPSDVDGIEQPLVVLLVEDNKINQRITSQQLRKRGGYIVHVVDHGGECLDFLDNTTFCLKETELSIILLDLEMPIMDGWACARRIRERQRDGTIAKHVPIIAVTANARPKQIASAIEAGADAVVTKPFRIPDLIPRMHEVVAEVAWREQNG